METSQPLVSIIIPAYNAAAYLPELCRSIQAQTHQHFEVLILDDASSDPTPAALAEFAGDRRFRLFRWETNRGVNAATSALLNQMRGEFWAHPGADDVLEPTFLAERVKLLAASPSAVMVHGPAHFIDAAGNGIPTSGPTLELPAHLDGRRALAVLLQHNIINTPSVLIRTAITRLVEPYFLTRWRYAQDWYLWLLHLASGFDLLWDSRPLHRYRIHARSLSLDSGKEALRKTEIRLVPFCALNAAAQFSPLAAGLWAEWRQTLYRLWLFRAAGLLTKGQLQPEWIRLAGQAYHGKNRLHTSLVLELVKQGLFIPFTGLKERRAGRRQSFRVSGIAQINDPIFFEAV